MYIIHYILWGSNGVSIVNGHRILWKANRMDPSVARFSAENCFSAPVWKDANLADVMRWLGLEENMIMTNGVFPGLYIYIIINFIWRYDSYDPWLCVIVWLGIFHGCPSISLIVASPGWHVFSWLSCETAPLAPKARNHGMLGPRVGSVAWIDSRPWPQCRARGSGLPSFFWRNIRVWQPTTARLQGHQGLMLFGLFGLTIFRWQWWQWWQWWQCPNHLSSGTFCSHVCCWLELLGWSRSWPALFRHSDLHSVQTGVHR